MDMCQPTRRSRRLQNLSPTGDPSAVVSPLPEVAAATEEDEVVDYTFMPQDPRGLDNFEFLVYTELRKWRLQRKRELEIEPYKICQNHTSKWVLMWMISTSGWSRTRNRAAVAVRIPTLPQAFEPSTLGVGDNQI